MIFNFIVQFAVVRTNSRSPDHIHHIEITHYTPATHLRALNMSTLGSQRQTASKYSPSIPRVPLESDENSKRDTTSPDFADTAGHTLTHIASPAPIAAHDIICRVISHFKLYCTGLARSLIFYNNANRREDLQAAISLLGSRLNTAEDKTLFYQLMRCLTHELPWLADTDNRNREKVADRESLAMLEIGWEKHERKQLQWLRNRDWQEQRTLMEQALQLVEEVRRFWKKTREIVRDWRGRGRRRRQKRLLHD